MLNLRHAILKNYDLIKLNDNDCNRFIYNPIIAHQENS